MAAEHEAIAKEYRTNTPRLLKRQAANRALVASAASHCDDSPRRRGKPLLQSERWRRSTKRQPLKQPHRNCGDSRRRVSAALERRKTLPYVRYGASDVIVRR